MSDLIKRSDAIRAFNKATKRIFSDKHLGETIVGQIPSADRPQGEWIETSDGTMCSNCHKFPYDDGEYHIANWSSDFCPHCGVRMKGASNGEDIQSADE